MKKIKEIMFNDGFDFDNPEGLEGTEFESALSSYKENAMELENLDPDTISEQQKYSLEMQEKNLIQMWSETVTSEDDPEIEELKQKELQANERAKQAEAEAERIKLEKQAEAEKHKAEQAEAKRISDLREQKLQSIEEKEKLANDEKVYLLNNKRKLNFDELTKIGIDVNKAPRKFEWNGYVFEKQWMFNRYVILSRPS